MALKEELIELSQKIVDYNKIKVVSEIEGSLELSSDVQVPYTFECEALHPGEYKGYEIPESEIIAAKDTIFNTDGNLANYEINKDHKSNRKENSSVSDVVGKVIKAFYDKSKNAYMLKGEVYDKELALKIQNKIIRFVSLRINPGFIENIHGRKIARQLQFEELSFVRAPGDPKARII